MYRMYACEEKFEFIECTNGKLCALDLQKFLIHEKI